MDESQISGITHFIYIPGIEEISVSQSRKQMSVSSAFNARIMKERKMFIFNPPPGISEHGANMQGFVSIL